MPVDSPASIALRREPGPFTRSLTALLLRGALGMVFLFSGIGKLKDAKLPPDDPKNYPNAIAKGFPESIAFKGDVKLFTTALPYVEIYLGASLILGWLTTLAGFFSGALLLTLLYGHIHHNNIAMYPSMMTYILVAAGVLWLSPVTSNYLSIDGLFVGWFWKPKGQGEYQKTEEVAPRRGR